MCDISMMQLLPYIHYPLVTLLFLIVILAYFKVAMNYKIFDKTNGRSSHNYLTIRGGGIVFLASGVLFALTHSDFTLHAPFLAGIMLVGIVSFCDDIKSTSAKWRLMAQVAAISLAFYGAGLFDIMPWWYFIGALILFTGILNAYNFMDGINGMTGLYSLIVLSTLQWVNLTQIRFAHPDFMWYGMLACGVFLWYNFRKKALCFAGDVGSISMAFWVVFLILKLIVITQNFVWILFLAVYGVETVCTLLHRLFQKQSIFKPHRTFFFQILCNECNYPQLTVSSLYSFIQLLVSIVIINYWQACSWWILGLILVIPLTLLYLLKLGIQNSIQRAQSPHYSDTNSTSSFERSINS